MDLEEILHKLEEAKELKDWDVVEECIEAIRVLIDDFDEYQSEEEWGWNGDRQMLFDNRVQQRLSMSRYKRLTKQNSDNSLNGLVIDWHLANTEMGFDNFVEPILDYQPTYAYA